MHANVESSDQTARLPPELFLYIIDCLMPQDERTILRPSETITKTLVSCCRVSRSTYAHATKLLRLRCVYVNSSRRLASIVQSMTGVSPNLPAALSLNHITTMYLEPFGTSLDDKPTATRVRELFLQVCRTLKRLIVAMPFATLNRLSDHSSVRSILREGFESLIALEEFVCLGDYPSLTIAELQREVWTLWPRLKHLVLFGTNLNDDDLWRDIASIPILESIYLPRCRGLARTNIKQAYFQSLQGQAGRKRETRGVKLMLVDVVNDIEDITTTEWSRYDSQDDLSVHVFEVPTAFYADESSDEVVASWVRRGAIQGSLWDWAGTKVVAS